MYARVISFVVKPYCIKKFCDSAGDIARDVVAKQPGFLNHMILISEREMRLIMVVSLWTTKQEADRYHEEVFPSVLSKLAPLVDSGPILHYYTAICDPLAAAA